MKRLIIMRHGKSSWADIDISDYNRPLNIRGEKSSQLMGEFIEAKNGKPDLIVSSSAVRSYETAKIVAQKMDYDVEKIMFTKELYLAWVNDILKTITSLPDNIKDCVLVGHNPGLTDLINHFGVRLDNLPTSSTACFEFEVDKWRNISKEKAELKWFQLARDL